MDDQANRPEDLAFCQSYPKSIIIIRWIILGAGFALGIYILTSINQLLGLAYVIYSLVVLGKVAAYLFPKGDESKFVRHYDYAIFIHLLWIIPLLTSFFQLVRARNLLALVVFGVYLFVLLVEKITLKKLACSRCRQREFCPAVPFRKANKV